MIVPFERLSPDALEGLIREFVTRDGTDYGEREVPLDAKMQAVRKQLRTGEVAIVFDAESQSCTIVTKDELSRMTAASQKTERDL